MKHVYIIVLFLMFGITFSYAQLKSVTSNLEIIDIKTKERIREFEKD